MNMGYGKDLDHEQKYHESSTMGLRPSGISPLGSSSVLEVIQEEYIDEETKILNRKGMTVLIDLYKNNKKFKDEVIDFIRDKTELGVDKILDKGFKYNSLDNLGRENPKECVHAKDYTRGLNKIIASYSYL